MAVGIYPRKEGGFQHILHIFFFYFHLLYFSKQISLKIFLYFSIYILQLVNDLKIFFCVIFFKNCENVTNLVPYQS